MKCSVYIAASTDGFIATPDGGVEWLEKLGSVNNEPVDMGFGEFMASVDCMVMGRKCMEKIASMQLTPEQWPYGETPIYVLRHTLEVLPEHFPASVQLYAGDVTALVKTLSEAGHKHCYVDGGTTITHFLEKQLITDMRIFQAPVLLGKGLPLFGELSQNVQLSNASCTRYKNDFLELNYHVNYAN